MKSQSTSKATAIHWEVWVIKNSPLLYLIAKGEAKSGDQVLEKLRSYYSNSFSLGKDHFYQFWKVAFKNCQVFLASPIRKALCEVSFPRVHTLTSHLDPFLGKGFLFWIHLSIKVASGCNIPDWASSLGLTYLCLSNSKGFVVLSLVKLSYQNPTSCSWENSPSLSCLPPTCGFKLSISYLPWSLRQHWDMVCHQNSNRPTSLRDIFQAARSATWQWRTAICRGSQTAWGWRAGCDTVL